MMKAVRKYLILLVLLPLAGCLHDSLSGSEDREPTGTALLNVQLRLPDGSDIDVSEVSVKVKNKEMPFSFSVRPDANGKAELKLQPGKYDITAEAYFSATHVSVAGGVPEFLLTADGIIDADGVVREPKVEIPLNVSVPGELVFREIYYHGSSTLEGTSYTKDRYLEIYNNTGAGGKTMYLDSLCLAALYPANSTTGSNAWAGRDTIPVFQMIWMFPGDGHSYPLAPGESAVVAAMAAVDHRGRCTSGLELGRAHFGCYDAQLPMHEIAAGVTPMIMYMTGQGTAWALSIHSPAVVLFKPEMGMRRYMDDAARWERYAPGESSGTRYRHIAASWILDGVDCADSPSLSIKRLPSSVDASYVYMRSAHYSGKCIRRVLESEEGGVPFYRDSNNSAADFITDCEPSPRLKDD
ncbi:MAG: DUF4876 domain-containing protein [Bacteroidales bacterium]|nr:DUF4876 domain-containing protein [Bacteroidales bacterium]